MFGLLLLYVAFVAASTVGGVVIASVGSHASRPVSSIAGVLACVLAIAVVTVAFTSSDLLATP